MAGDTVAALGAAGKLFLLAVGFVKPHPPFVSPQKYRDLYDESKIALAPLQQEMSRFVEK
mgnify:CR=1 FL=1